MVTDPDSASFGFLLKAFRKRRRLTQQEVAESLGIHRRTLGRWEQGDYLPESKSLVLELARCLKLDDQEIRRLLEASLTALTPYWLAPLPRNPFFTGREEILEALHAQLGIDQAVALTQSAALHGLGGVGKTQIALEYAYRHALEYSAVFWIGAETSEQIFASLLHIAEVLQLPEREDKDQQRAVAAVQRWLATHGQWLLIWDNVEDLNLLPRFLSPTRQGTILITTRCQVLGTLARGLDLSPMEQEEGLLFLLRRAKVLDPETSIEQVQQFAGQMPEQYQTAAELVEELGGLPLALDQAGAYLEETHCGFPAYLERLRTRRVALLQQRGEGLRDHPESVSATFTLAMTAIAQRHPAVADLLRACALFQPDAIPEELFRQGGRHLGASLQAACDDPLEWDRVVGIACSYSLLSRQPEQQTLSIHRLVQAVLLDSMGETERKQWHTQAISALDAVLPEMPAGTEFTLWNQCERLLPHALLCLHRAEAMAESLMFASLADKVARYLRERAWYTEAQPLTQHALRIREQVLGPEHPQVADSLITLANLCWQQGEYEKAEPLYQRALRIREQALGADHPEVANSLNNLALLYHRQGKYLEAEQLSQRALHIQEQVLGPEHPQVAFSMNTLAILFYEQGKYAEAERLYQRALRIQEHVLGPDHHDVAQVLNNLAELFREQGKDAEAEPLYRRALAIWEQQLGPEHPHVAHPLSGLAILSRGQGKYEDAEPLFQRVLSIRESSLGPHHPDTAETLHDLALLRRKQGHLSEAISLAERALLIRSQSLREA
ncbi:MAG TPA: FxSxx-COOH system tetratricopeptide repeat protein, partial [Ktedonobacteraceae bacterium]|nr:FxSxx-COOH system tetratricopeptide repeat protein [Ktedonobacteraceae bacterium]